MNLKSWVLIGTFAMTTTLHPQQDTHTLLQNQQTRNEIFQAIVGDHELMMDLISHIKENEHATMMIHHMLPEGPESMNLHNPSMSDKMNEAKTAADIGSPYKGQEMREVKSLSKDDIQQYLNGEGMGMAKAAELNRYPGPRHVLQIADKLQLSEQQNRLIQESFDQMHATAVKLGKQIVENEKSLNDRFSRHNIDQRQLDADVKRIARLQGELRLAHLQAHLKTEHILSSEQVKKYNELRGYNDPGIDHSQHNH